MTEIEIPIDPKLPKKFDQTPNEERPASHRQWWFRPYIVTCSWESWNSQDEERKADWFKAWPSGTRYMVRCLDGGAWDRSTGLGAYGTLEEALEHARAVTEEYQQYRDMPPRKAHFLKWEQNVMVGEVDKDGNLTFRPKTLDDL